jgi:outer membrane protein assembly factor BamB
MKTSKFRILIILLLFSSLLAACAGGATTATSWPGVTVDLERETVYVAYNTHLYAVNLAGGTEKWRFPAEADNKITFFAAPALSEDGQLILGGYDNLLYSLDPANGQQNWSFDGAEQRYVAASLTNGETIFAPNSDNNLYVLNLSGRLRWQHTAEHSRWGTPVTDGEVVYAPSMDHHLYALRFETGDLVWKTDDLGGAIAGDPTFSPDGVIYVGTFGSELLAIDQDGRTLWRVQATGWVWSGPALDGETLYFGDLGGTLFAVNAADGSVIWQVKPDTSERPAISDSPLLVDDTLYFVTEGGNIYAVDATTGNTRWTKNIEKGKLYTAPVVAGDTILIAPVGTDAILYAFDTNGNPKWQFTPAKD